MKTRNVEIPYIISFVSQMIDDEPLTAEILDIFHQKQANFLESWEDMPSPIIRLVKRNDGHEHVEQVLRFYDTAKPLLQYMWPSLLRATLHGGTARTLQVKTLSGILSVNCVIVVYDIDMH